jgi:hypothetical protein
MLSAPQHPTIQLRVVVSNNTTKSSYLKTSLTAYTTFKLAKHKTMISNIFSLSSLKTKHTVKETCKPDVQVYRVSNIIMMH